MKYYGITPTPKPRMTQSDKWKKRPPVARYFQFCNEIRAAGFELPDHGASIVFYLPMPKSWSRKKQLAMNGKPHQAKPDLDNLLKALSDAVYNDDAHIWHYKELTKLWSICGHIAISTDDNINAPDCSEPNESLYEPRINAMLRDIKRYRQQRIEAKGGK